MTQPVKRVDFRVPEELLTKIDQRASKVGLSRNEWLVKAARWAVSQPVKTETEQVRV